MQYQTALGEPSSYGSKEGWIHYDQKRKELTDSYKNCDRMEGVYRLQKIE